jgi:hypothetical protein
MRITRRMGKFFPPFAFLSHRFWPRRHNRRMVAGLRGARGLNLIPPQVTAGAFLADHKSPDRARNIQVLDGLASSNEH